MRCISSLLTACAILLQLASPLAQAQISANDNPATQSAAALNYFAQSERSKQVGEAYFQAYMNLDWQKLGPLLAEQSNFSDPTARLVFGNVNVSGKAAILQYFQNNYAGLTMKFLPIRKIYSGHYAIFEGMLDWTYPGPHGQVRVVMPFMNVLQIENGLVVKHMDLADYHPFFATDALQKETGQ